MSQVPLQCKVDNRPDATKVTWRQLPPMPIRVSYPGALRRVTLNRRGGEVVFCFQEDGDDHRQKGDFAWPDAFQLREQFLLITDPYQAFDFLEKTGLFPTGSILHVEDAPLVKDQYFELTWTDFCDWQHIVRSLMLYGPWANQYGHRGAQLLAPLNVKVPKITDESLSDLQKRIDRTHAYTWLMGYPDGLSIQHEDQVEECGGPPRLWAVISQHRTIDAILATTYIDRLAGKNHRICDLPECMNIYEVTSKQPRQYCTNAHAHKAAVRRKRAELRQAAERVVEKLRA